jgi:peptidyl-prolyl cis-trans isomerase B (cyclophilin B)
MIRHLTLAIVAIALCCGFSSCQTDDSTYALIQTEYGDMKVMLYNSTPKHRDNFIKLVNEGYYDSLLFHRVINGFMIQGGDPDSRKATPGQMLGMGGPEYKIDPEIGAPHLRGALAAARDNNPLKQSSGSQFYIVQGQIINDEYLNTIEQQKGIKYSPEQRKLYKEEGGAPFLDNDYTVFGEVVEGFETINKITSQPTDSNDRPQKDVRMTIKILK